MNAGVSVDDLVVLIGCVLQASAARCIQFQPIRQGKKHHSVIGTGTMGRTDAGLPSDLNSVSSDKIHLEVPSSRHTRLHEDLDSHTIYLAVKYLMAAHNHVRLLLSGLYSTMDDRTHTLHNLSMGSQP